MKRSAGISGVVVIGCVLALALMLLCGLLAGCAPNFPPASAADTDRAVEIAWRAVTTSRDTNMSLDDPFTVVIVHWVDPDQCLVPLGWHDQRCVTGYSIARPSSCLIWAPWRGSMCESAQTLVHETLHCKQSRSGYTDAYHEEQCDWASVKRAAGVVCEAFP